jgi:hypothetical protein
MEMKKFHLGDVLSVTTGRLLSPRGMDGIYDILSFMTGCHLFTHQLPRASDVCKPYLLEQFPQLDSPEVQFAVGELIEMLKTPSGMKEPDKLILGWISKLTSGQYGVELEEMLEVKPLIVGVYEVKNPIEELVEMAPNAEIVVVDATGANNNE